MHTRCKLTFCAFAALRCHNIHSTSLPGDAAAPVPEAQRIPFNVIGNEAGFFPSVVAATRLLLGPAERYDLVLDFSQLPADVTAVYLLNEGPEGPFTGANLLEGLTLNTVQVANGSAVTHDACTRLC